MDMPALRAKGAEIKARLRFLKSERDTHALVAVNGDAGGPQARQRIGAIDLERDKLTNDLETVEVAQQQLFQVQRQAEAEAPIKARRTRFERDKEGLSQCLPSLITRRYDRLAHDVGVQRNAGRVQAAVALIQGRHIAGLPHGLVWVPPPVGLADIPFHCARELVGHPPYVPHFDVMTKTSNSEFVPGTDGEPGERVYLDAAQQANRRRTIETEWHAQVDALANELLAATSLPPIPAELLAHARALRQPVSGLN